MKVSFSFSKNKAFGFVLKCCFSIALRQSLQAIASISPIGNKGNVSSLNSSTVFVL